MQVICVDDEQPILDNFKAKVSDMSGVDQLQLFKSARAALEWVENHPVDVAFLDMEMPEMSGLELARKLRQIDPNIRIIFVTAYGQYALDAFGVDALGYVLKPYTRGDIEKELEKAMRMRPKANNKVVIRTMPEFMIRVAGKVLHLGSAKQTELLALLVDRGEVGVTTGEAIACLWPNRPADESTQTLYRVTYHRLVEGLREVGAEDILHSAGRKRYIRSDQVDCDLYRMLQRDENAVQSYAGEYLREYSWAESRVAQLDGIKMGK